ncbi:MAG: 2-aminoethylphosphonate--pyruvate transaminase [Trichocoleus desertorum ATA4-8-CV12]|jgi:2-aminoethylphosphonate-pyruvate transaminase|nr:2-aminoethylphosphonate--pyruvate transaminase [Trichocoleus desertorum ATA4-8-CV12]
MNRTILLNPGPVTLSDRVRQALLRGDWCHREPEFAELTLDIKCRLVQVYPEAIQEYEAVLLTGSGTCAVEAMLSTLIPQQGKALVVCNGVYGERMAAMIAAHRKAIATVTSEWHKPMDLATIENYLIHDPAITHVVAVHHETTTGRLNDIAKLGQLCKRREVALLLDTVSSFGAEAIDFANWNLEACASTANKCLHGVPGLAFVLVKRSVFETRTSAANSLYLDLYRYYQEQKQGFSPFTQAVQVAFALQEALKELEELGGWKTRHLRYRMLAQRIRGELKSLGFDLLLPDSDCSISLTSFQLLPNLSYTEIHDSLKRADFIIYAGQGGLKNSIFRIANMGDIQNEDVDRLLNCFRAIALRLEEQCL